MLKEVANCFNFIQHLQKQKKCCMFVKAKFKCSLTHSTLIQHFNMVERGGRPATGFNTAVQQNRTDVEANVYDVCAGLKDVRAKIFQH